MQLNFLVACPNEVIDNMGGRSVTTGAAKPLAAGQALDYAARVMNAAIPVEELQVSEDVTEQTLRYTHAQACGGSSFSSSK